MMDQQHEIRELRKFKPHELMAEIEMLSTKVSDTEAGRETYRKRFLEEREAKKYLEEHINRVKKE